MVKLATLAVAVVAVFVVGCGSDQSTSSATRYVALGDSNTSGAGLPTPITGAPEFCYRTESGYPSLAAKRLGQDEFETVACSGAGMYALVAEMPLVPSGDAPKQLDALKGNETIVSLTIGDNDAGFGEVTRQCLEAKSPAETPCRDKYVTAGENKLTTAARKLAKPLGDSLDSIRDKSPRAKVFVVGYAPIIPKDGAGCWGDVNVSPQDAPVFYGWQQAIRNVEQATAKAHGATFVDLFKAGAGHDACKPASERWTNPVNNVGDAGWPLHPTIAGSQAAADLLVNAWRQAEDQ